MSVFIKITHFLLLLGLISFVHSQIALPAGCLDAFRSTGLALHNQYRALHATPALRQNSTLDASALAWANTMASTGVFQHSSYGENLWAETTNGQLTLSQCSGLATSCVSSWYNEISAYNYNNPGFSEATGHFTQLIWYSSTDLGMGLSWGKAFTGSGNGFYCVAHYLPYGNDGRVVWTSNVLPLASVLPTTASTRQSSILTTLSLASTSKLTTLSSSSSSTTCQNLAGYDNVCSFFSAPQYGFCNSNSYYVGGVVFYSACKKSCNLCTVSTCTDSVSYCASWANNCNLLVSLNPHPCKATCKLC